MTPNLHIRLGQQAARHADKLRFLVVGGIGFSVDGGFLLLLNDCAGWSPLLARSIGFPVAITVTWWLNRIWTFQTDRSQSMRRQYAFYLAIQLTGMAINFSIFALLVRTMPWFVIWPIAALAIGSIMAMFVTYILSRRIVFAATKAPHA
ncbi:MAG: GtrA family protein [Ferrovibrio sp.]|uniref:GtrA family protein n=1 Tax=Ferrovibrio sp. TaxID=1917215 RepID=UPI0026383672|nr:GtrA family protein [Ferrovibrio sp.]MCW0233886.1 GtrA family protein [Ferrovibrio sp.]